MSDLYITVIENIERIGIAKAFLRYLHVVLTKEQTKAISEVDIWCYDDTHDLMDDLGLRSAWGRLLDVVSKTVC